MTLGIHLSGVNNGVSEWIFLPYLLCPLCFLHLPERPGAIIFTMLHFVAFRFRWRATRVRSDAAFRSMNIRTVTNRTRKIRRATRRLTINAYLVGDDYAEQRDRLITAIETAGPGTLIHPQFGEMQGCIDGQVTVSHSSTEGRMCRVSFQFVESGELSFPVAGAATARKLESRRIP